MIPPEQTPEMERFYSSFNNFRQNLSPKRGFICNESFIAPRLTDATATTGFDNEHLHHAAWAAREIQKISPLYHVDISSNLYFVVAVSAFVPVKFYDYRPPILDLPQLEVNFADVTQLPFEDSSIPSVSSLSVIEHIGLGRYGDTLDPDGDLKAINELKRVIQKGGSILINVPIALSPLVAFNAHRIYSKEQIMDLFPGFTLKDFTFLHRHPDLLGYTHNLTPELIGFYTDGHFAGGCFHFVKN